MSKDCPNCPAFGKHCPHKANGDPYFYDCYLTVVDLEKENAELKKKNLDTQDAVTMQIYTNKANKEIADRQLTKAKEIIKKFSEFVNNEIEYDSEHPQEHTDLWNKLCEESEEFLKEE